MRTTPARFVKLAFLLIAATALAAGCGKKDDAVAQAEKKDVAKGIAAPGIAETKAIAEEGFIYGLPIVMNYAVMYEYAVDKKSGQFKAPFNEINNEPRVATYKDTAIVTPNSDTPYSFLWLDLRAEPMVISVPAVEKERYYSVQLIDGNTYNYGYIGSRATGSEPATTWSSARTGRARRPRASRRSSPSTTPFSLARYPHAALQPGGHAERREGPGRLQGPAAVRVPEAARAAGRAGGRFPAGRPRRGSRTNYFEYLDAALQFVPPTPEDKEVRARLARIGIGPGKTFDFKDLSLEHKAAVLLAMKEGDEKVDKFLASGVEESTAGASARSSAIARSTRATG